jgi:hypothetical protein
VAGGQERLGQYATVGLASEMEASDALRPQDGTQALVELLETSQDRVVRHQDGAAAAQ